MAASEINFKVTSVGEPGITNIIIGNMTDVTGTQFYAKIGQNPWTWYNMGNNVNPYGLLINYTLNGEVKTALAVVDVDPDSMSGKVEVPIVLKKCEIGPGNFIQKATVADGITGISVNWVPTEPTCTLCDEDNS